VRYYVTFGAESHAQTTVVDVDELPNGSLRGQIDGRACDLDVVPIGRHLSVRVNGRVVDLTTQGKPPEIEISASGFRSRVRVESERTRSPERTGSDAGGGQQVVKSPMPGRVVKVLVAKGDAVQAGQALVVLEAMKMENEVRALAAGTVVEVHVTAGAKVEGHAALVTLVEQNTR
jgi:glutaconyl-CoA/methylmalonyl-CoA decarboxylase subunit gamma